MLKTFLRALLKPFSFIPAILMMYLIFSFSSQDGTASGNLSYKVSEVIVESANEAFELHWSDGDIAYYIERIHYPVRKLAHMTEYFLLAISVSFPLYVYGIRGLWLPILAGGLCVGFAALDEYHQSFVAGRGPAGTVYLLHRPGNDFPSFGKKAQIMMTHNARLYKERRIKRRPLYSCPLFFLAQNKLFFCIYLLVFLIVFL